MKWVTPNFRHSCLYLPYFSQTLRCNLAQNTTLCLHAFFFSQTRRAVPQKSPSLYHLVHLLLPWVQWRIWGRCPVAPGPEVMGVNFGVPILDRRLDPPLLTRLHKAHGFCWTGETPYTARTMMVIFLTDFHPNLLFHSNEFKILLFTLMINWRLWLMLNVTYWCLQLRFLS